MHNSAGDPIRNRNPLVLTLSPYVRNNRHMDSPVAILALAALAQPTRLDVFRLLIKHEPDGRAAGDLAKDLAVPHNTMSSHLSILTRAGLVSSQRRGRSIVYRADLAILRSLMLFLLQDCCGGEPRLCASLIDSIKGCCPPDNEVTDEVARVQPRV